LEIAQLRIADRVGFLRFDPAYGNAKRKCPECGSTEGSKAVEHEGARSFEKEGLLFAPGGGSPPLGRFGSVSVGILPAEPVPSSRRFLYA
jgi:hypothetical protein